jgi:hypothetical protein
LAKQETAVVTESKVNRAKSLFIRVLLEDGFNPKNSSAISYLIRGFLRTRKFEWCGVGYSDKRRPNCS